MLDYPPCLEFVFLQAQLTHAQTAEHGLVELRVGSAGEEGVQLVEDVEVGVVAVRARSVAALHYCSRCISIAARSVL